MAFFFCFKRKFVIILIGEVKVRREDIDIIQDREKGKLYCNFSGINQIDYQPNTFNLVLFDERD